MSHQLASKNVENYHALASEDSAKMLVTERVKDFMTKYLSVGTKRKHSRQ